MELSELNADEHVALVALVELMIESGVQVLEEEAEKIDAIVAAIGEDAYRRAAEQVDDQFIEESDLRAFLPRIKRQEARELIYETVLEAAIPGTIDPRESELLQWLAGLWKIDTHAASGDE